MSLEKLQGLLPLQGLGKCGCIDVCCISISFACSASVEVGWSLRMTIRQHTFNQVLAVLAASAQDVAYLQA